MTDSFHSKARIQKIHTEPLEACWQRGEIPVIAGFQGVTDAGELTTLGRGGSDTSAVALAVALDAAFCEINTDVDGVFTADPRVVKAARLTESMDFEVALEMASLGSKVLHARCVELGAKYNMPIVVRNTFTPNDHQRTKIMRYTEKQRLEAPVVSGITLDRNVAKITVDGLPLGSPVISDIFNLIAKLGVNVDIIVYNKPENSDTMRLGFTVERGDSDKTLQAVQGWSQKQAIASVKVAAEEGFVKVSAVGLGMQSHPGVASKTFAVLAEAQVDIHMISTSEIKISCVVGDRDGEKAAQALHRAFIEG